MRRDGSSGLRVVFRRADGESSVVIRSATNTRTPADGLGRSFHPRDMLTASISTTANRGGYVTEKDVRLDKWLQVARVFKTRAQARRACDLNRVRVNGAPAKAHRKLQIDDRVETEIRDWQRILVVRELHDRPIAKKDVPRIFEDLSPPRPTVDPLDRLLRRAPVVRERGRGRPSKRERRDLERLRDR